MDELANNVTKFVTEPKVPFPQADSFVKIIDLLANLYTSDISKDEITTLYDFDKRQTDYYANSCVYLGLATSYEDDNETMIKLNDEGRRVMELPYRQKYLTLASKILEHEVFKEVYDYYVTNGEVSKDYIVNRIKKIIYTI